MIGPRNKQSVSAHRHRSVSVQSVVRPDKIIRRQNKTSLRYRHRTRSVRHFIVPQNRIPAQNADPDRVRPKRRRHRSALRIILSRIRIRTVRQAVLSQYSRRRKVRRSRLSVNHGNIRRRHRRGFLRDLQILLVYVVYKRFIVVLISYLEYDIGSVPLQNRHPIFTGVYRQIGRPFVQKRERIGKSVAFPKRKRYARSVRLAVVRHRQFVDKHHDLQLRYRHEPVTVFVYLVLNDRAAVDDQIFRHHLIHPGVLVHGIQRVRHAVLRHVLSVILQRESRQHVRTAHSARKRRRDLFAPAAEHVIIPVLRDRRKRKRKYALLYGKRSAHPDKRIVIRNKPAHVHRDLIRSRIVALYVNAIINGRSRYHRFRIRSVKSAVRSFIYRRFFVVIDIITRRRQRQHLLRYRKRSASRRRHYVVRKLGHRRRQRIRPYAAALYVIATYADLLIQHALFRIRSVKRRTADGKDRRDFTVNARLIVRRYRKPSLFNRQRSVHKLKTVIARRKTALRRRDRVRSRVVSAYVRTTVSVIQIAVIEQRLLRLSSHESRDRRHERRRVLSVRRRLIVRRYHKRRFIDNEIDRLRFSVVALADYRHRRRTRVDVPTVIDRVIPVGLSDLQRQYRRRLRSRTYRHRRRVRRPLIRHRRDLVDHDRRYRQGFRRYQERSRLHARIVPQARDRHRRRARVRIVLVGHRIIGASRHIDYFRSFDVLQQSQSVPRKTVIHERIVRRHHLRIGRNVLPYDRHRHRRRLRLRRVRPHRSVNGHGIFVRPYVQLRRHRQRVRLDVIVIPRKRVCDLLAPVRRRRYQRLRPNVIFASQVRRHAQYDIFYAPLRRQRHAFGVYLPYSYRTSRPVVILRRSDIIPQEFEPALPRKTDILGQIRVVLRYDRRRTGYVPRLRCKIVVQTYVVLLRLPYSMDRSVLAYRVFRRRHNITILALRQRSRSRIELTSDHVV